MRKNTYSRFLQNGLLQVCHFLLSVSGLLCLSTTVLLAQQHSKVTGSEYSAGEINGYWRYLPQGYNQSGETFPLIVYLHGNSGRGNGTSAGLDIMLETGLTRVIHKGSDLTFTVNAKEWQFLALSPQKNRSDANWNSQDIAAFISYAVETYRVNPSRVYLVGYSMGGRGVYEFLADTERRDQAPPLAAVAVLAGSYSEQDACLIASADLPLLHYHSIHDNTATVTYSSAQTLIEKINNCQPAFSPQLVSLDMNRQGTPIDHDATDTISFNPANSSADLPNLYRWFLRYTRGDNGVEVGNLPPHVYAGEDLDVELPLDSLVLAGSVSDEDGSITSYLWKQLSGPAGPTLTNYNSPEVIIKNLRPGDYVFQLTAIDDKNDRNSDEIAIHVEGVVSGLDDAIDIDLEVFPNPFTEYLIIKVNTANIRPGDLHLSCTDAAGRSYPVKSAVRSASASGIELKVSPRVTEGFYLVTITSQHFQRTFRLLKE
ncbi:alpha/beta hydrolase [Roseivirga sp. BDSF3-8]|uniref:PKD domain-containing protein n=1 Tax=Roseivirga sp. BDSF3-8 TaxID=3241598 RepID=UPI0035326B44